MNLDHLVKTVYEILIDHLSVSNYILQLARIFEIDDACVLSDIA